MDVRGARYRARYIYIYMRIVYWCHRYTSLDLSDCLLFSTTTTTTTLQRMMHHRVVLDSERESPLYLDFYFFCLLVVLACCEDVFEDSYEIEARRYRFSEFRTSTGWERERRVNNDGESKFLLMMREFRSFFFCRTVYYTKTSVVFQFSLLILKLIQRSLGGITPIYFGNFISRVSPRFQYLCMRLP